jgi:hypothetical protein
MAQKTFRDIVGRGLLGDVEMKIFTAFRNLSNGVDGWMYATLLLYQVPVFNNNLDRALVIIRILGK